MTKKLFGAAVALALATTMAPSSQAAEVISINLENQTSTTGSGFGNAFNYSTLLDGTPLNLQITAWSLKDDMITDAKVREYSGGLGITNRHGESDGSSPQHSIDNRYGYDFLLLEFDRAVDVNAFRLGWSQTDPDVSALWGNVDPSTNLLGMTSAQFYGLFGVNNTVVDANTNGTFSTIPGDNSGNWWILGALDTVESYLSCGYKHGKKVCETKYKYDYFKIDKIKLEGGTVVPEPATWMMMILGIGAAGAAMRRRQKVTLRFDRAAA